MKKSSAFVFTSGPVFSPLVRFALPVLGAQFLQAMYGGIDLLIVGQFSATADVSGVSTGSMIMHSLTMVIIALSMGITILTAQKIGEGDTKAAGQAVGTGITLFALIGVLWTVCMILFAEPITRIMQAPEEAFAQTAGYVRICGGGALFITAYNLLGSIFRGTGDSKMPLITVAIAAALNIAGDLFFVAKMNMGAAGAAWATIISQAVSVIISFAIIRHRPLPFAVRKSFLVPAGRTVVRILKLGCPLALQDFLVGISFLVIMAIVNSLGVVKSAGVGVAEKVCAFIMLLPSSFSQSVSTFVAQNFGAGKIARARKSLFYGIAASLSLGIFVAYFAFFHGNALSALFSKDPLVVAESHSYLRAYAIDTILTSFLFCFIGFFNGCGKTFFSMAQGIAGAFLVRIPFSFIAARTIADPTLFQIGLATPCSTVFQILLCVIAFARYGFAKKADGSPPRA